MSRTAPVAATLSLVLAATAGYAQAAQTPATQTPAAQAPAAQTSAQQVAALPQPADAATRAAYERTDALSRSVFWSNEYNINPMDPVAGVKLAQALRELGQFEQAATAAENVLTAQPGNTDAMLELGRAHIARGQAFYGITALENARNANPRDWRPLSLLGVAYQQVRRHEDAQIAWGQALALSPDNPDILTNSAIAYMGSGDLVQAETLLRRAAAQPNASLKVHQNLALAMGLQGNMSGAEAILRRQLPPEQADQNLAWLAARTQPGSTVATPASPTPVSVTTSPSARSWTSLQQNQP